MTYAQEEFLVLGWRLEAFERWRLSMTLPRAGSEADLLNMGLCDSGEEAEAGSSSHSMSSRLVGKG